MKKLSIGFTLIEMLVVISIIGILATLVAANLNAARSRARDAQRKSDIKNIETALRLYYNDKGRYPDAVTLNFGSGWSDGPNVYMQTVPQDPLYPAQQYFYGLSASSTDSYNLHACLENGSDLNGTLVDAGICSSGKMFQVTQ